MTSGTTRIKKNNKYNNNNNNQGKKRRKPYMKPSHALTNVTCTLI